jgi:hypothetical protein
MTARLIITAWAALAFAMLYGPTADVARVFAMEARND